MELSLKQLCTSEADSTQCTYISEKSNLSNKDKKLHWSTFMYRFTVSIPMMFPIDQITFFTHRCFYNSTPWIVYRSLWRQMEKWKMKFWCISSATNINHKRLSPAYKYLGTREIQKSLMLKLKLDFLILLSRIRKNAGAIFSPQL